MLAIEKTMKILFVASLMAVWSQAQRDEDLIDISNITVFPQDYQHSIYAGYLNITAY